MVKALDCYSNVLCTRGFESHPCRQCYLPFWIQHCVIKTFCPYGNCLVFVVLMAKNVSRNRILKMDIPFSLFYRTWVAYGFPYSGSNHFPRHSLICYGPRRDERGCQMKLKR